MIYYRNHEGGMLPTVFAPYLVDFCKENQGRHSYSLGYHISHKLHLILHPEFEST